LQLKTKWRLKNAKDGPIVVGFAYKFPKALLILHDATVSDPLTTVLLQKRLPGQVFSYPEPPGGPWKSAPPRAGTTSHSWMTAATMAMSAMADLMCSTAKLERLLDGPSAEHEVKTILEERDEGAGVEYLVAWKKFKGEDTWEPAASLATNTALDIWMAKKEKTEKKEKKEKAEKAEKKEKTEKKEKKEKTGKGKTYPNSGKAWTEEELRFLFSNAKGFPEGSGAEWYKTIAKTLGRDPKAVSILTVCNNGLSFLLSDCLWT